MKKSFIWIIAFAIIPLCSSSLTGQCIEFIQGPSPGAGGPFIALQNTFPCGATCGTPTATGFDVWSNEGYLTGVLNAGNNYDITIAAPCGMAGNWPHTITVAEWNAGVVGTVIASANNACALSFTTTNTIEHIIIITETGICNVGGDPPNQINGGAISVDCGGAGATNCAVCGANGCEASEDYCTCNADCQTMCNGVATFVDHDGTNFTIETDPVAWCQDHPQMGGTNPVPEAVYIPFAPIVGLNCITTYNITSTEGTIVTLGDIPVTTGGDFGVLALRMTDADITASGGTTTITFTDGDGPSPGNCTFNLVVNWGGTVVNFNTDAATTCPGVCSPPAATFISYDCAAPSVTIDVTDLGTPTAGSSGFTWTVEDEAGTVISTVPVAATGNVVFPLPDNMQIYNIVARDGITAGCDVGFFNNINLYGACRTVMAGCTDIILEGNLETAPPVAWTESSTDVGGTATGFAIVGATPALAGTNGAWLGGYGNAAIGAGAPFTTTLSQTVTIPAGTATLYFWAEVPIMQTSHTFTLDVDGTILMTNADVLPNENLNWREYMVNLSAFADGAAHTITFNLIEDGTDPDADGFFQTNIFIDDVMLESCGGCPPDYATGSGNQLTGTEAGTADYETDGSIDSDQIISSTAMVDYDSAIDIDMLPNFEVQLGAVFCAFIDGCNGGAGGVNLTGNDDNASRAKSNDNSVKYIEMGSSSRNNRALKSDKYQRKEEARIQMQYNK